MEKIKKVLRSTSDRIDVISAASTEKNIKFYVNELQYFCTDKLNGHVVTHLKSTDDFIQNATMNDYKKQMGENPFSSVSLKVIIVSILLTVLLIFFMLFTFFVCKSPFKLIISLLFYVCLINLVLGFAYQDSKTSKNVKSKHASEHMVANFMYKHCRLPESIEELKSASRITKHCGTRYFAQDYTSSFFILICATLFSLVYGWLMSVLTHNGAIEFIISVTVFILVYIVLGSDFIEPESFKTFHYLNGLFSRLFQLANTSSSPREADLLYSFMAAAQWMYVVYPNVNCDDEIKLFLEDAYSRNLISIEDINNYIYSFDLLDGDYEYEDIQL